MLLEYYYEDANKYWRPSHLCSNFYILNPPIILLMIIDKLEFDLYIQSFASNHFLIVLYSVV